jgi:hypothetical protein
MALENESRYRINLRAGKRNDGAARPPSAGAGSSGKLRTAHRFFVQDLARTRLATATARCHAQTVLQILKIGCTERGRLADFPLRNSITNTDVHFLAGKELQCESFSFIFALTSSAITVSRGIGEAINIAIY